jgi:hypothetical protein
MSMVSSSPIPPRFRWRSAIAAAVLEAAVALLPVGMAEVGIVRARDGLAAPGAWLPWHERGGQLVAQRLVLAAVAALRRVRPGVALAVDQLLAWRASLRSRQLAIEGMRPAAAGWTSGADAEPSRHGSPPLRSWVQQPPPQRLVAAVGACHAARALRYAAGAARVRLVPVVRLHDR